MLLRASDTFFNFKHIFTFLSSICTTLHIGEGSVTKIKKEQQLFFLFNFNPTTDRVNCLDNGDINCGSNSQCVVPENIHTPPPSPRRALLFWTPTPLGFPFRGVLIQLTGRHPLENIFTSKIMLLHCTVMRKLIVSAIKREKIF